MPVFPLRGIGWAFFFVFFKGSDIDTSFRVSVTSFRIDRGGIHQIQVVVLAVAMGIVANALRHDHSVTGIKVTEKGFCRLQEFIIVSVTIFRDRF
jgi:hypothetical protein